MRSSRARACCAWASVLPRKQQACSNTPTHQYTHAPAARTPAAPGRLPCRVSQLQFTHLNQYTNAPVHQCACCARTCGAWASDLPRELQNFWSRVVRDTGCAMDSAVPSYRTSSTRRCIWGGGLDWLVEAWGQGSHIGWASLYIPPCALRRGKPHGACFIMRAACVLWRGLGLRGCPHDGQRWKQGGGTGRQTVRAQNRCALLMSHVRVRPARLAAL